MRANFLPVTADAVVRVVSFMSRLYGQSAMAFDSARARRASEWLVGNPESGGIWLIEADGIEVGYLVITVCVSVEFQGRFALLDELYIEGPWRGRGIAGEAIEFAAAWAKARRMAALRLEVAEHNAHGQHVYRKNGFVRDDRHIMTKWL